MITIAVDAMGGDNSPDKTLKGVKLFLKKNKKIQNPGKKYKYYQF